MRGLSRFARLIQMLAVVGRETGAGAIDAKLRQRCAVARDNSWLTTHD
jgi:hypothetical protein